MSDCASIDPLVTPYIDDELDARERGQVDSHLLRCPACRSRVRAERTACGLLRQRKGELARLAAPPSLRARCASMCTGPAAAAAPIRRTWVSGLRPSRLAMAATVLLGVAVMFGYRATLGATEAVASELALDHLKCFTLNTILRTHESLQEVEDYMRSGFDWAAELPEHPEQEHLTLVGSRPCLYEHGKVAHIMYRHRGVPVSIFMLPGVHFTRAAVQAFGHDAVIWNDTHRTFVLVAKAPRAEVERVATFVRASLR